MQWALETVLKLIVASVTLQAQCSVFSEVVETDFVMVFSPVL